MSSTVVKPKVDSVTFILFDPNGSRREALLHLLKQRAIAVTSCYSTDKLKLIIERHAKDRCVIIFPEALNEEVQTHCAPLSWNQVPYLDDLPSLSPEKISAWLDTLKPYRDSSVVSIAKGSEAKILDLVLIGSSTGGIPVVQEIIKQMDFKKTRVILCQHISAEMSKDFASNLRRYVKCPVIMVSQLTALSAPALYVLAGRQDFQLEQFSDELWLVPALNKDVRYHPSFDLLTQSFLNIQNKTGACIILSGLGNDGSSHLQDLKVRGIEIIVQDPVTSVASGMPTSAIQTGAVKYIYTSDAIRDYLKRNAA